VKDELAEHELNISTIYAAKRSSQSKNRGSAKY
jgi:hypothetical protein